ncbi:MAG: glycosyltransferase family 39 protein [Anaerolineae bacterium]|nr:glycosyltransferase family 39 protein [Anaerolineae bacterium]NUQ05824.1 glycosyltransferase family 39 protein [Anaerolineae bacterium]
MSIRLSYVFAVILFLIAAVLRFASLNELPPGLSDAEIDDVRIAESVRSGRVEVFYDLDGVGREGLYQSALTGITAVVGSGAFGFRILSLFIGLIGLALVYAVGTRLCGPLAGIAAMGLLAVNLSAILLSRTVAREAVLMAWTAAIMLALARAFFIYGERRGGKSDSPAFLALGVLLGLGFYIHPLSLVLTMFAMTFIVYRVLTTRPFPRRALSFTWFTLVITIVLAMPYVLSTIQLPDLAGTTRLADDFPASLSRLIETLAAGINGFLFVGDLNPAHNMPGRPLFDLVSGVIMAVGLLTAAGRIRESGNTLLLLALLFLVPATLLAPASPNFLITSALLPPLAMLFGMGVSTIFYSLRGLGRAVSAVGLVALFGFNLVWAGDDLLVEWGTLPETQVSFNARLGALAHFLNQSGVETPALLCAEALQPAAPGALTDAHKLALMMHRADAPLRAADCNATFILINGGAPQYIVMVDPEGLAKLNPEFLPWLGYGQVIEGPGIPPNSIARIAPAEALANRIGAYTTTTPITFAPDEPAGNAVALPPLRLEGNLTFLGYDRRWADAQSPGDLLLVVTYWRVDGILPPDLAFFTHVQDDPGARPVAQRDGMVALPEMLEPRDVLIQASYVDLPFSLPTGDYSISVGAYESAAGRRLAAFIGDEASATRLYVGGFTILR